MKSIFKRILDILDSMSRARAATHFVRMGRPDLAKAIMLGEDVRV
jgi:hypothetical protein